MKQLLFIVLSVMFSTVCFAVDCGDFNIKDNYSQKNKERRLRSKTTHIVVHTTESSDISALNSVKRYGTTHYLVQTNGTVHRIIERNRLAYHAGRSMWFGKTNVDSYAIGIEVVGYHNKKPTQAQICALKELLSQLQNIYSLNDDKVVTHSMVAYGSPNRWHKHKHRGRKRCGMLFANGDVRKQIGLNNTFSGDPDVVAGRLKVADKELFDFIYSKSDNVEVIADVGNTITKDVTAWDIMRGQYDSEKVSYHFPDGRVLKGSQITNWSSVPVGTKVSYGKEVSSSNEEPVRFFEITDKTPTAWSLVGSESNKATTIYFIPDGRVLRGDEMSNGELSHLENGTKILVGYVYGGHVSSERSAYQIAKGDWNDKHTLYRLSNGTIIEGDALDEKSVPVGALVLFRR